MYPPSITKSLPSILFPSYFDTQELYNDNRIVSFGLIFSISTHKSHSIYLLLISHFRALIILSFIASAFRLCFLPKKEIISDKEKSENRSSKFCFTFRQRYAYTGRTSSKYLSLFLIPEQQSSIIFFPTLIGCFSIKDIFLQLSVSNKTISNKKIV